MANQPFLLSPRGRSCDQGWDEGWLIGMRGASANLDDSADLALRLSVAGRRDSGQCHLIFEVEPSSARPQRLGAATRQTFNLNHIVTMEVGGVTVSRPLSSVGLPADRDPGARALAFKRPRRFP